MKRILSLVLVLPALLLAGCSSAQTSPQGVAESYLQALAKGDYKTACSYLEPAVTQILGSRCEQNLEEGNQLSGGRDRDINTLKLDKTEELSDTRTTVYFVLGEETIPVTTTEVEGKWYVAAG